MGLEWILIPQKAFQWLRKEINLDWDAILFCIYFTPWLSHHDFFLCVWGSIMGGRSRNKGQTQRLSWIYPSTQHCLPLRLVRKILGKNLITRKMSWESKISIDPGCNSFCCGLSSPDKGNQMLDNSESQAWVWRACFKQGIQLPGTKLMSWKVKNTLGFFGYRISDKFQFPRKWHCP